MAKCKRTLAFGAAVLAASSSIALAQSPTSDAQQHQIVDERHEIEVRKSTQADDPQLAINPGPGDYVLRFSRDGNHFAVRSNHPLTAEQIARIANNDGSAGMEMHPPAEGAASGQLAQDEVQLRIIKSVASQAGAASQTGTGAAHDAHATAACADGMQGVTVMIDQRSGAIRHRFNTRHCIAAAAEGDHVSFGLAALRASRETIAADANLPRTSRDAILTQIDSAIARMAAPQS